MPEASSTVGHVEPCGALRVAQNDIVNIRADITDNVKPDISLLYKRVDRLPTWMVMLWGATTGCLGAALTAIFFLGNMLGK